MSLSEQLRSNTNLADVDARSMPGFVETKTFVAAHPFGQGQD